MTIRKTRLILTSSCMIVSMILGVLSPQSAYAASTVPVSFDVKGSGFGHGVGLSQYGARGMALAGYTADQIVNHYYLNTTVAVEKSPTTLRIGLAQDQQYVAIRGEALGGQGGHLTVQIGTKTRTLRTDSPVVFTISDRQALATFADGTSAPGKTVNVTWNGTKVNNGAPSVVNVVTSYSAAAAKAALGAACKDTFAGVVITNFDSCPHRYRYGTLQIAAGQFADTSFDLNVVNTLRLSDEYLYGLGEVPSSWEPAALAAQVIAARSYALATYNDTIASPSSVTVAGTKVRSACLCHVYSSIVDQNFVGYNKEYSVQGSRWTAAVDSTIPKKGSGMGKVILYHNKVIKAFFSSATGGASQPIKEVWGSTSYPWSGVVDDHWALSSKTGNPNISWVHTIKQGELVRSLNNVGIPISSVKTFKVASLYPSGAVSKLTVSDADGHITQITVGPQGRLSPDTLRWVLGIKSTYLQSIEASKWRMRPPGSTPTPTTSVTATPKPSPRPSSSATRTTTPKPTPRPTPTPLKFIRNVDWPDFHIAPGSYSVTGTVDPKLKGVTVTLNEQVKNVWTAVSTTTTSVDGSFILPWPKADLGSHILKIVAKNKTNSIESPTVTRIVNPVLSIRGAATATATATVKSSVMLQGNLVPVIANATVTISRQIGSGPWTVIRTTHTNQKGRWGALCGVGKSKAIVRFVAKVTDKATGTTKSRALNLTVG